MALAPCEDSVVSNPVMALTLPRGFAFLKTGKLIVGSLGVAWMKRSAIRIGGGSFPLLIRAMTALQKARLRGHIQGVMSKGKRCPHESCVLRSCPGARCRGKQLPWRLLVLLFPFCVSTGEEFPPRCGT